MISRKSAYRVGWLIDGSGQPALEDRVIIVEEGRFQSILDVRAPLPPDIAVVDLSDCTVFPALVDSHVHLVMSGSTDPVVRKTQLESSHSDLDQRSVIARHLDQHLACGVLAVRDGGDQNGDSLKYKCRRPSTVTIAAPGRARNAPGRYGKLIGIPVPPGTSLAESLFSAAHQRDHVKLVNSGLNSLTQFGVETPPQFTTEELKATVVAARTHGLPTMVHANGHLPVQLAVEAGCTSIEHGFFMGHENMQRMADRGVVWVPTAVTMKAYQDYLQTQGHRSDASFADVSRKNLEHQLEQIRAARQLGVILAVGTDAGSPGVHHGLAMKTEIQLFIDAGLNVEEAIQCATLNGARLMGLSDRGAIATGMRADFLTVRTPPQTVPEALHQLVYRVVGGRPLDSCTGGNN
ncbi:amidohydrolase family protein [Desulfosarcina ovata]|uniref:Amidohydrolase n=1 Tax=Desulfosarcina ovata subsp. ovata TaxID=2752305 RepID=A0A5K8A542_9BACT|nr:amidohydrolase family protein [Desulfosarcina ovata]BBO87703.1 amidohydrolase [Desulfosarcina ovata subsp. ovata]